jgi:hypothetical protein
MWGKTGKTTEAHYPLRGHDVNPNPLIPYHYAYRCADR